MHGMAHDGAQRVMHDQLDIESTVTRSLAIARARYRDRDRDVFERRVDVTVELARDDRAICIDRISIDPDPIAIATTVYM